MKIYVASSWRNLLQQGVVHTLRAAGHEVYDYKHPHQSVGFAGTGQTGFRWSDVDPNWQQWTTEQYIEALQHPIAKAGFASDRGAMEQADACVLVMPCGRSAHLEAGYFIGAGKPLYIVIPEPSEPELMYAMATKLCASLDDLLKEVGTPSVIEDVEICTSPLAG